MKKLIFCNIPMKKDMKKNTYNCVDFSLPVSEAPVAYPINAFLEKNIKDGDDIKIVLLVKKDEFDNYKKNIDIYKDEFSLISKEKNIKTEYKIIDTPFSQDKEIHYNLLTSILDEMDENIHILADITFGPKDLPIILFTALNLGERFLNCEIDNIIYGKAVFLDNKIVNTEICDMSPLYYLNSITNTIKCNSLKQAKQMLNILLKV